MHPAQTPLVSFFWLSFRHCPRKTWCEPEFPASSSIPSPMPDRRPSRWPDMVDEILCGSSAYFGYTPALWNISRISRRADIVNRGFCGIGVLRRARRGLSRASLVEGPIFGVSDVAMGASAKIDGARVEVALDRAARLDILVKRLNSCLA